MKTFDHRPFRWRFPGKRAIHCVALAAPPRSSSSFWSKISRFLVSSYFLSMLKVRCLTSWGRQLLRRHAYVTISIERKPHSVWRNECVNGWAPNPACRNFERISYDMSWNIYINLLIISKIYWNITIILKISSLLSVFRHKISRGSYSSKERHIFCCHNLQKSNRL